jgi:LuxR family transcriptional regulator, maltose regulon positive regulatory protein
VQARAEELVAQGRSQTLANWIGDIPECHLADEPWLRYWLGVAQLAMTPEQAQQTLTQAHKGFKERKNVTGQIMVASAILHAFYVSYARFTPAKEWIALLSELLKTEYALPSRSAEIQANAVMLLANIYRHQSRKEVEYWFRSLDRLFREPAPDGDHLMAGIALLSYAMVTRDSDIGYRTLNQLSSLEQRHDIDEPLLIMWLILKAEILQNSLELAPAIAAARRAQSLASENGQRYTLLFACFVESQAHLKSYNFREAERLNEEVAALCDYTKRVEALHVTGILPFRHVYAEDYELAVRDGMVAYEIAKETHVPFFIAVWVSPVLFGYAGSGKYSEALRLLAETRSTLAGTVSMDSFEIIALTIEAYCALKSNEWDRGIKFTREALQMARDTKREGILHWAGPLLTTLLGAALKSPPDQEQARKIIRRFNLAPPENGMDPEWEWEIRLQSLGRFEIAKNGAPMAFPGKLPKKSLALLKLLIANGPAEVPEK